MCFASRLVSLGLPVAVLSCASHKFLRACDAGESGIVKGFG
jgi:hypothetical protein